MNNTVVKPGDRARIWISRKGKHYVEGVVELGTVQVQNEDGMVRQSALLLKADKEFRFGRSFPKEGIITAEWNVGEARARGLEIEVLTAASPKA